MSRHSRHFKTLLLLLIFYNFYVSVVFAELTLKSVYPTVGEMNKELEVTLTGTGFDSNTKVSMTLDVGNQKSILASVGVSGDAQDVSVVGDFVYVVDYDLQIFRIRSTTPPNLELVGTFTTPGDAVAVTVVGNVAYVADGDNGLILIDISDPSMPVSVEGGKWSLKAGSNTEAWGVTVVNQIAYVAYGKSGLQVIDVSDPEKPEFIAEIDTHDARGIAVVNGRAYLADNGYLKGLVVIDVSQTNPKDFRIIDRVILYDAFAVEISGDLAFVANGNGGLQLIDIHSQSLEYHTVVGSIKTPGSAYDVAVVDSRAYVAAGTSGLQIIDITDPTDPKRIGSVDTSGWAWGISVVGERAYVAHGTSLVVADVSKPALPKIIAAQETSHKDKYSEIDGWALGVELVGSSMYVAVNPIGLKEFDISDPKNPQKINTWLTNGSQDVEIEGNIAYLAEWDTLRLVDLTTSAPPIELKCEAPEATEVKTSGLSG